MKTPLIVAAAGWVLSLSSMASGQIVDKEGSSFEEPALPSEASSALFAIDANRSNWSASPSFESFASDFETLGNVLSLPQSPGRLYATMRRASLALSSDLKNAEQASEKTCAPLEQDLADLDNAVADYNDANEFARKAIRANPKNPAPWLAVSLAELGLGRAQEALSAAQESATLNSQNAAAWRNEALAYAALGQKKQALNAAWRALSIDPADKKSLAIDEILKEDRPHFHLGLIAANWDTPSTTNPIAAEADKPAALAPASHTPNSPANSIGGKTVGFAALLKAPSSSGALLQDAADKIAMADYDAALADAAKATTLNPRDIRAYYYQAAANNMRGLYEAAIQQASHGLSVDPADVLLRDERAWALNRLGRMHDAISDANAALESNPRDAYAYANLSQANEQQGEIRSALADLGHAAAISPGFASPYQKTLRRYGLFSEQRSQTRSPIPWQNSRDFAFLLVLSASLLGGSLIAMGALQLIRPGQDFSPVLFSDASPTATALSAGIVLGKPLGFASLGEAYAGWDAALERAIGVKIFRGLSGLSASARRNVLNNIRVLADLRHPALIDVYSVIEDKDGFFLTFEAPEGRALKDVLQERGALGLSQTKTILKDIGEALRYALARDVSYPYLKAESILLTPEGLGKIMDFGVAMKSAFGLLPSLERSIPGLGAMPAARLDAEAMETQAVAALARCLLQMTGHHQSDELSWSLGIAERYATIENFLLAVDRLENGPEIKAS